MAIEKIHLDLTTAESSQAAALGIRRGALQAVRAAVEHYRDLAAQRGGAATLSDELGAQGQTDLAFYTDCQALLAKYTDKPETNLG